MKWTKQGRELAGTEEAIAKEYANKEIYIYGSGIIGERFFYAIQRLTDWTVKAFIDKYKAGDICQGLDVLSLEEFSRRANADCLVLIALHDDIGQEVKEGLSVFLENKRSICKTYNEFMRHDFPLLMLHQYQKVVVNSLSCIVTERCTLRCEKCAIMLPYFKNVKKYEAAKIKEEIDLAFSKIDFVGDFTFTGGEPLLNQELEEVLGYIAENYLEQIGSLKIITNGMIEPGKRLLNCMKKYGMYVEISDYTATNPELKQRVMENYEKYRENGIRTYLLSSAQWVDFGFEALHHEEDTESSMEAFFDYCHTNCRGYIDGKIWYCINARFAEKALEFAYDESNMLELGKLGNGIEEKAKIVEFDLGYNARGYLTMCRRCNGGCDINTHYIEVGRQCRNL